MCLLLMQPQEVKPALRSLWGFTPRSSKETSGVDKTGHLLLSVNIRMRCQGGLLRYLRRYMEITTYALYVLGLCYFWNLQFWVQVSVFGAQIPSPFFYFHTRTLNWASSDSFQVIWLSFRPEIKATVSAQPSTRTFISFSLCGGCFDCFSVYNPLLVWLGLNEPSSACVSDENTFSSQTKLITCRVFPEAFHFTTHSRRGLGVFNTAVLSFPSFLSHSVSCNIGLKIAVGGFSTKSLDHCVGFWA